MKIFTTLLLCLFAFNSFASKKAVTDEGDVVILHNDGTWKYEIEKVTDDNKLLVNPNIFTKNDDSTFVLKSNKTNSSFAINPKKWKFKKIKNGNEVAEYTFDLKDGDLYAMVISEQIEIEIEQLANIAFTNAQSAAADMKIVKKEYRIVNGKKVIYMEMVGTIQSVRFKYLAYYYSDASGSTQYLTYTGENLVNKYKDDINDFLNGFSITP